MARDETAVQVSEREAGEGRSGPSRTAAYVTLFRAIETGLPPQRRLFEDPFAAAFLGRRLRGALTLARAPLTGRLVPRYIDRRWPGARVAVLVRTRFIDEAMSAALAQGAGQVVILGSGFDARAYRVEAARGARVFEVDEPATLAKKRERIESLLGELPRHVSMVAMDFEHDDLGERLRAAGFAAGEPAFFIWEGVTGYLSAEAVDATLRQLAALGAPGSQVVFTYLDAGTLAGGEGAGGAGAEGAGAEGAGATIDVVRRAGEPFRFGLDPAELAAYLAGRGFELIEDASSAELAARYLHPLGRHPVALPFFRLALAASRPQGGRDG